MLSLSFSISETGMAGLSTSWDYGEVCELMYEQCLAEPVVSESFPELLPGPQSALTGESQDISSVIIF